MQAKWVFGAVPQAQGRGNGQERGNTVACSAVARDDGERGIAEMKKGSAVFVFWCARSATTFTPPTT